MKKAEDLFYQSVIPLSCQRLLHPDVEEFIIKKAEELQSNSGFHLTIQLAEEPSLNTKEITSIVHRHFESKREETNYEIKKILRLGLRSLFIGFAFLIIMFLLTKILTSFLTENAIVITLREFFIILGWVALWRPADLLLYEWRPHQRKAKLFDRIVKCKVQVTR